MLTRRAFVGGLIGLLSGFPLTINPTAFDVYLTFDDGPTSQKDFKSGLTDRTLEILKKEEAPSTFFLHGRAINDWEGPVLVRMINEGHAIGNHLWRQGGNTVQDGGTWALLARQYLEAEIRIRDLLQKTDSAAYETYLKQPKLFRRPGGFNGLNPFLKRENLEQIRREPYMIPVKNTLDWLKEVYDYSGWHINAGESIPPSIRPLTAAAELKWIMNGGSGYYGLLDYLTPTYSQEAKGGLIILLHDAAEATVQMLPDLIAETRKLGGVFRALPRPSDQANSATVGIGYAPTR
jgi:peptidoglycan/xylan/chitin deacetylase (PgdA/CDA1 family)